MRLIMGKNCIREVLKSDPKRFSRVFSSQKDGELVDALKSKGVRVQFASKQKLYSLVQSESHQSFVAEVKERKYPDLKTFLEEQNDRSLVVLCDSITDPQNFGAILRASECFGVDGVVWSKNRNVGVTPVVSKVSVGASELLTLIPVSNLAESVKKFQEAGYVAVAAESREGSESLFSFSFPDKVLLILGAEGKGIQPLLSKRADHHLEIPMLGRIDSLNVSQAAAIFLSWGAVKKKL